MHEMSLCESIVELVSEQAGKHHFDQAKKVVLEVGAVAGVEIEALRFGFDVVAKGSVAEGAKLEIQIVPARAHCEGCDEAFVVAQRLASCPVCGGFPLQLLSGDELRIKELEVE